MPISVDLRERVLLTYREDCLTMQEAADDYSVGVASVNRWLRLQRETGGLAPRPHGGGRALAITDFDLLRELIASAPDSTLAELCKSYEERTNKSVPRSSMDRAIHKLGITRKKSRSTPLSVTHPESKR